MADRKKIIIIGGGVAGYPAAIRAARVGAEVVLIEKDTLGGTCLNRGCIPTKAMLQSAGIVRTMKEANKFGINCKGFEIDLSAIMERKNSIVSQLTKGVKNLLAAKKVQIIHGTASFTDSRTVQINEDGKKMTGDCILIASGSQPGMIPIKGINGEDVLNSDQLLDLKKIPKSAAIIGGGVIGVEFAQILSAFGTEVVILELMPGLIPGLDPEIAAVLEKSLQAAGIKIITEALIESISAGKKGKTVKFTLKNEKKSLSAESIIMAVGRKPDFSLLNVDRIGIRHENGKILVNECMETNVPGIFAAGDVTGGIMLAHLASAEGECAVRNALGNRTDMDYKAVPSCIYTTPEIACVGLTEQQAKEKHEIKIGRFPLKANGKALVMNETEGMVKIIAEKKYGEVLGVHIVGPHATDMIAEAVLGMTMEITAEELAHAMHPHPTVSEAVMEAAMTVSEGAIHMP